MAAAEERARLSRDTVVEGALALADDEGLDGLTIRRLAQRLGVTPMALYWHFKNKEELLDGLADRMWAMVDTKVDPAVPWPERLRALMASMVGVLSAHPAAAQVVMSRKPESARHCFDTMEVALAVLEEAGFSPAQAAALCRHGLRTAATLAMGDPGMEPGQTPEERAESTRQKRLTFATLPPDRYPHIIDAAGPLTQIDDFGADFGLDLFVAGVTALAARQSPPSRP